MRQPEITEAEFEQLFRRHAADIRAYLRVRVGPDSDDLLSEVFVIAWRRRRDLPEPELLRGWLFGAARRLVLAELRRRKQARGAWEDLAAGFDQDVPDTVTDRTATVRRIVQALPERDRELLMLTTWEGLSITEAAVATNMRPGTARVRLHRARQRLARDPHFAELLESRATSGL